MITDLSKTSEQRGTRAWHCEALFCLHNIVLLSTWQHAYVSIIRRQSSAARASPSKRIDYGECRPRESKSYDIEAASKVVDSRSASGRHALPRRAVTLLQYSLEDLHSCGWLDLLQIGRCRHCLWPTASTTSIRRHGSQRATVKQGLS